MNIKALIFDLDGTAIPKKPEGMPSQRVIEAVKKAKKICHVSVATGRPYALCADVCKALEIDDLCIVNGGTHLYSLKTHEFAWKQEMDTISLQEIFFKLKMFSQYDVADEKRLARVPLEEYRTDEPVGLSCIFSASQEDAKKIISIVRKFEGVDAHAVGSWKTGTFDIHISHELATKKHALQSLLARLDVNHADSMVVGDGGNDLPLFELAGLKIAMGNAEEVLKEKADWIAPTVEEDGLAVAIEKYIL
jgi:5-amino-6-(5-phospho-D-ribitylamino)uracil phosphatase